MRIYLLSSPHLLLDKHLLRFSLHPLFQIRNLLLDARVIISEGGGKAYALQNDVTGFFDQGIDGVAFLLIGELCFCLYEREISELYGDVSRKGRERTDLLEGIKSTWSTRVGGLVRMDNCMKNTYERN